MTQQYRFRRNFRIVDSGCWIWLGSKFNSGYGKFAYSHSRTVLAHRFSMHLYKNFDLDSKMQINHKPECGNRICVNPDHLYIGDQWDNMKDLRLSNNHPESRKIHCPQGHEYNEENTLFEKTRSGRKSRRCRTCRDKRNRKEE